MGKRDVETLFDLHEELDQFEAIAMEVFDDPVVRPDLLARHPQLFRGDLADPLFHIVKLQSPGTRHGSALLAIGVNATRWSRHARVSSHQVCR